MSDLFTTVKTFLLCLFHHRSPSIEDEIIHSWEIEAKSLFFLFNNCLLFACTCDFFLHADFTSFSTIQSLIWQNVNHIIYWMKFLSYSFTISYVNDDEISLYSAFALLFLAGSFEVWLIVWSLWFVEWMNHNFDPTLSAVYCFYFDD